MADTAFAFNVLNVLSYILLTQYFSTRSLCFTNGSDVDKLASVATFGEHHCAVTEGIESVVFSEAYILTGVVDCATLTFEDVAGLRKLAAKDFDAKSLAF